MTDAERLRAEGLAATEDMLRAFGDALAAHDEGPMQRFVGHLHEAADAGDVAIDRTKRVAGIEGFEARIAATVRRAERAERLLSLGPDV